MAIIFTTGTTYSTGDTVTATNLNNVVNLMSMAMASGRLVGRATAGPGPVEEIALGNGFVISGGVVSPGWQDTDASHFMRIACGSDLTADRIVTIAPGDSNRTLTLSGDATLNQDLSTGAGPTFTGLTVLGPGGPPLVPPTFGAWDYVRFQNNGNINLAFATAAGGNSGISFFASGEVTNYAGIYANAVDHALIFQLGTGAFSGPGVCRMRNTGVEVYGIGSYALPANPPVNNGAAVSTLFVYTGVTQGAGVGGAICLGGMSVNATGPYAAAQIAGRKANGTNADYTGYLEIGVNNSAGSMVTVGRWDESSLAVTGQVDITKSAADAYLTLHSAGGSGEKWYIASRTTGSWTLSSNTFAQHVVVTNSSITLCASNVPRAVVSSTGLAVTGGLTASFNNGLTQGLNITETTDASGAFFAVFRNAGGTAIGSISRVGATNAVAYNTSSDARLKTNVRDFTGEDSGRILDGLRPRWFDWKGAEDESGRDFIGFVAQEEHEAEPALARIGAITVGDSDPDTIGQSWQRNDAALIPILVAEIKALRARLAAAGI